MYTLLGIYLCALEAVVFSAPQGNFVVSHEKCIAETGVSSAVVSDANGGTFADDPKLAKYLVCVGKEAGMIDASNHINKEVLKSQMLKVNSNEAIVNSALDKCAVEKGSIEETAMETTKCMFSELHK